MKLMQILDFFDFLVELNKSNELFSLAHSLIDVHPEYAVSWLAVGCYYFLIGRQDPARRFLKRAISIDNMNGPCWLVNAHSFAAENEHDQVNFCRSCVVKGQF